MNEIERREFLKSTGVAGCFGLFGGCKLFQDDLRYRFGGELHRDFHASILDGYNYIKDEYGEEAIRNVMGNFARSVHRSMHDKLTAGDPSELLEFWRYYLRREGADFTLDENADGAVLTLKSQCPAHAHLAKRKISGAAGLCSMTRLFNEELAKGTPYTLTTEASGDGTCRQILKRRASNAL